MTTTDAGRRRSGALSRLTIFLLSAALSTLGCTTRADAAADLDTTDVSAYVAAQPVEISWFNEATYTSLAADRGGALHAVWLDRNPETQRQAVYHRASSDGGRTWGDPTFLSEGQPDGYTGIPRLVTDAAGRVYTVWKVVDRATSMAEQELRSTPAFGTLVYRVLENGGWSPVRALGTERAVVAWFAATDSRGRTHVVWSENPEGPGFLSTTADAGTLRQVQLDGATPRGGQVISGASRFGKLGYWSLSGYVDAHGVAHWVAVRGSDAEGRTLLVHSNNGSERTLPYYTAAIASAQGARTPPQLVLDLMDEEHLILYEGGPRPRLVDRAIRVERSPIVIMAGADAEAIQDFQVSTAGRRVVVTMEVTGDDGNRLADLYVSRLDGDGWTTPDKVTDNARQTRAQGVTDAKARSLGTVKVRSTIHASVVPERSGALHVLLTSRETSRHVDTRAGGMSGASARSRAWFMTIPGTVTGASGETRRPAQQATPAEDDEPAPARETSRGGVAGAAAAEQLFARYDVTEDGWLSGTELNACDCRSADADRDGEVTKAEFLGAATRGRTNSTGGISRAEATREAEQLFARYDITEGGWLSGTELNACNCRGDDVDGDGRVTKAEFMSGFLRRAEASSPGSARSSMPSRSAPSAAARTDPPNVDDAAERAVRGAPGDMPVGKYNCYANGAGRPMPWEPGYGGAAEAPRATTQYMMNLTVTGSGSYQYLNRGRGSYRVDARTGAIEWISGPFASSGIRAAYGKRGDGRPVIYLELEGTRAHCVGPQP